MYSILILISYYNTYTSMYSRFLVEIIKIGIKNLYLFNNFIHSIQQKFHKNMLNYSIF